MIVLSKTSVPSLSDIASRFSINAVPARRQMEGVRKLRRSCSSLDIFKGVVSRGRDEGNLVGYSRQKIDPILALKGVSSSRKLQKFDRNGLELSPCVTNLIILWYFIEVVSKTDIVLQQLLSLLLKRTAWRRLFRQMPPEWRRGMYFVYFHQLLRTFIQHCWPFPSKVLVFETDLQASRQLSEMLVNLRISPFVSSKTKKLEGTLLQTGKSSEMPACLDSIPQKLSLVKNPEQLCDIPASITVSNNEEWRKYRKENEMKLKGICFMCQKEVKKKNFFDERRFGILRNCTCMICYGCLRKEAGTTRVVEGPIKCPLCSVESDTVAASSSWIEGEVKLTFFNLVKENRERGTWKFTETVTKRSLVSKAEEKPLDMLQKPEVPTKKCNLTPVSVKSDIVKKSSSLIKGEEEPSDKLQKRNTCVQLQIGSKVPEKSETVVFKSCWMIGDKVFDVVTPEVAFGWTDFPAKTIAFCTSVPMIQVN